MAGHRFGKDAYDYCGSGGNLIVDPGADGTINIDKNFALCNVIAAAAETRYLPYPANVPVGIMLTVISSTGAAGAVTLKTADTSTVATLAATNGKWVLLTVVKNASAVNAWLVVASN